MGSFEPVNLELEAILGFSFTESPEDPVRAILMADFIHGYSIQNMLSLDAVFSLAYGYKPV